MQLEIHRGSQEIGGSCVELTSGKSRIVLDVGMPLVKPDGKEFDMREHDGLSGPELLARDVLPKVTGLYTWQTPEVDAVLISHAHQDHYGFLSHVHPDIPVYMSAGTRKLIEITASFTGKPNPLKKVCEFSWLSRFNAGAFTVVTHLVDHSSFSSFAFEIEADGKRLFYSGDFREHGHIGKSLDILYEKVTPGVDALLLEGTMLGRAEGHVQTEHELSIAATDICKRTEKAVLVYQSGQNISRAVSFYKAARSSNRLFVPDVYMAHVLSELGQLPEGARLPRPGAQGFENVRVWYPHYLTKRLSSTNRSDVLQAYRGQEMTTEEMAESLDKIILFVRPAMEIDMHQIQGIAGSTLVYSLWEGYKTKDRTRKFLEELKGMGITIETLHTSGHADIPALSRMVDTLKPGMTIPIHTFHPDDYVKLFGASVRPVRQGEKVEV